MTLQYFNGFIFSGISTLAVFSLSLSIKLKLIDTQQLGTMECSKGNKGKEFLTHAGNRIACNKLVTLS